MVRQQLLHVALGIRQAGLHQILGQGTQADDLPGVQSGQQHQSIQPIVLRMTVPAFQERLFKKALLLHRPQGAIAMHLNIKNLNPLGLTLAGHDLGGLLPHHSQAKIFQCRQDF